jgi:hypothetical protein
MIETRWCMEELRALGRSRKQNTWNEEPRMKHRAQNSKMRFSTTTSARGLTGARLRYNLGQSFMVVIADARLKPQASSTHPST